MSSNCKYYQHLMSQMLDADLLDAETDALHEHIRTCPDCRKLCAAFSSMTLSLRDDIVPPPEGLTEGVMARIYAHNTQSEKQAASVSPAPQENTIEALPPKSKRLVSHWPTYVAAACLVVLLGTGLLSRLRLSANSAAMPDMAMAVTAAADEVAEAAIPESLDQDIAEDSIDTSAEGLTTGTTSAAQAYSTADDALTNSAAQARMDSGSAHTILDPDQVPAGRETDFEALLTDAGWPDGEPDMAWHSLYAVEYHGVIYEFLTDDQQQYLLWHDAAEGLYTHSAAAVDDLWDIFGN